MCLNLGWIRKILVLYEECDLEKGIRALSKWKKQAEIVGTLQLSSDINRYFWDPDKSMD